MDVNSKNVGMKDRKMTVCIESPLSPHTNKQVMPTAWVTVN